MHIEVKGTTPGVELGKELSLLVEEWSSPKSRKARADADGPQPVTYSCHIFHADSDIKILHKNGIIFAKENLEANSLEVFENEILFAC